MLETPARPSLSRPNLYDALEITGGASDDTIYDAYRKLSKQCYPDRNGSNKEETAKRFMLVHEAFLTLSDAYSRTLYDKSLRSTSPSDSVGSRGSSEAAAVASETFPTLNRADLDAERPTSPKAPGTPIKQGEKSSTVPLVDVENDLKQGSMPRKLTDDPMPAKDTSPLASPRSKKPSVLSSPRKRRETDSSENSRLPWSDPVLRAVARSAILSERARHLSLPHAAINAGVQASPRDDSQSRGKAPRSGSRQSTHSSSSRRITAERLPEAGDGGHSTEESTHTRLSGSHNAKTETPQTSLSHADEKQVLDSSLAPLERRQSPTDVPHSIEPHAKVIKVPDDAAGVFGGHAPLANPIASLENITLNITVPSEWIFPLPLTLETLLTGAKLRYKVTRNLRNGSTDSLFIDIEVKPGWRAGTRIRFAGIGHERPPPLPPQDVVFVVEELAHPRFRREGAHLYCTQDVTLLDVLAETSHSVTALSGEDLLVDASHLPGGIFRPGHVSRIAGQGMPSRRNSALIGYGDLYITWNVIFPENLSDQQRNFLRLARDSETEVPGP